MPIEDRTQTIEELLAEAVPEIAAEAPGAADYASDADCTSEVSTTPRSRRRRSDRQAKSKEQLAEISRRNGSNSHGPTSEEGKRASSLNAMTHGFTANILLTEEDPAEFARLFQIFYDQFQPATPAEDRLVRNIALSEFRLDCAILLDTNLMDFETDIRARKLRAEFPALDQAGLFAVSFREAHRESSALDLVRRYEVAHERSTARNIRLLLQLQQARLKQEQENNIPVAPSVNNVAPPPETPMQAEIANDEPDVVPQDPQPNAPQSQHESTPTANFETNPVRHAPNVIPSTPIAAPPTLANQEDPLKAA